MLFRTPVLHDQTTASESVRKSVDPNIQGDMRDVHRVVLAIFGGVLLGTMLSVVFGLPVGTDARTFVRRPTSCAREGAAYVQRRNRSASWERSVARRTRMSNLYRRSRDPRQWTCFAALRFRARILLSAYAFSLVICAALYGVRRRSRLSGCRSCSCRDCECPDHVHLAPRGLKQ